jgi:hypothetical protein
MQIRLAQSKTTWAEDKALQRCNLSADPGAKTGGGIEPACSIPPVCQDLRDWPQSEKPSRQEAAKSATGCPFPFTNTNPTQFHFPLDQDTTGYLNPNHKLRVKALRPRTQAG